MLPKSLPGDGTFAHNGWRALLTSDNESVFRSIVFNDFFWILWGQNTHILQITIHTPMVR